MEKTKKQDIKTKFSKEDISLLKEELTPEILKQARNEAILNFATKLNSTISNNAIVKEKKNLFADRFDKQTVNRYLENPQQYEKQIRQLSTILTTISAQYARISDYLSSICIFRPIGTRKTNKYMNQKGKILALDFARAFGYQWASAAVAKQSSSAVKNFAAPCFYAAGMLAHL